MSVPPNVGMIGIGNIGLPIARNVMGRGIRLLGRDLHNMDAFTAGGGLAAASPAAIAEAVEIVIHCIPPEALDGVLNGPDGLLAAKAPRLRTVVEISTYPLETKRALRDRLADRGIALLDCEMSGTARMIAARMEGKFPGEDITAVIKVLRQD